VTRDDAASPVGFLNGSYDELRSDNTKTGGVIRLSTSSTSVSTEARNGKGGVEWNGKLDLQPSSRPVQLDGDYKYVGKADHGHHKVIVLPESGDLTIERVRKV
jgi:hypothetical protein